MNRAMLPRSRALAVVLAAIAVAAWPCMVAAEPPASASLSAYLASWDLDRSQWAALAEPGDWNDAKQSLVLRLLARLARLPADRAATWQAEAADASSVLPAAPTDALVRIEGRAVFVAPQRLSAEEAALAGRANLDIVRIVTAAGEAIDVIVESAPKAWQRWATIDEPAAVVGLPLASGSGPAPVTDGKAWPSDPPALVLLGTRIFWHPATVLGRLGMDYATFDTVVDGRPLVAGDTEAFYGMLAAAGRTTQEAIAAAAGGVTDVIPLIDPAEKWFASHRGEPVTVEGVARRATRIAIDDESRRRQVGADHYWELYVFVPTPPIRVDGHPQDDFPIVCCVRSLPQGMPTGDRIGERVRISGFALKRYAYPLQAVRISSPQGDEERRGRRETPLVIGNDATWIPAASARQASADLGWVLVGIAAVVGLLLAAAAWAARRGSRRADREARDRLPDRIELPPGH